MSILLVYFHNDALQNKEILKYHLLDVQSNACHQIWPNVNSIHNINNKKMIEKEQIEKLIF